MDLEIPLDDEDEAFRLVAVLTKPDEGKKKKTEE